VPVAKEIVGIGGTLLICSACGVRNTLVSKYVTSVSWGSVCRS
jgi:hypothetical protein